MIRSAPVAIALLLATGCASAPDRSTVGVQVTAQNPANSRFAALVQKQTNDLLSKTTPAPSPLKVTAVIEQITAGPVVMTGRVVDVPNQGDGHAVASISPNAENDGVRPMVGSPGGGAWSGPASSGTQQGTLLGNYAIADASGKTLEAGPLAVEFTRTYSPAIEFFGLPVEASRNASVFLASRVAALTASSHQ
jgi:hypothetical protein